jgi:hypothetical protein
LNRGSGWLVTGGVLSLLAALIHLGCIAFGASWFRFFGAPEPLIVNYANGAMGLVWITVAISMVLALWAAFAFSGAGLISRLPLLRTGLIAIAAIYLLRGAMLFPALVLAPYPRSEFDIWSSAVVLVYGIAYAVGTWLAWPSLRTTRVMS